MPVKGGPSPAFSLFIHLFPDVSDHVPFQGTGLRLDSTATRHTWRGVPLWLHGPTYPGTDPLGVLTKRPCSSSLAMLAPGPVADVGQVFQADETVGVPVHDAPTEHVVAGRVGSGCPSQDHPSPSLRTGRARFPRIRLALYS